MSKPNPWRHPSTLPRVKDTVVVVLARYDTTHVTLSIHTAFYDHKLDCFTNSVGDVLCIQAWRRLPVPA